MAETAPLDHDQVREQLRAEFTPAPMSEAMETYRAGARDFLPAVADALKAEIEAMAVYPPLYSMTAYTPRRTVHTTISNGFVKTEGAPSAPLNFALQMAHDSVVAARTLRASVQGDAVLIWRAAPGFDPDDGSLRMRLCFESL